MHRPSSVSLRGPDLPRRPRLSGRAALVVAVLLLAAGVLAYFLTRPGARPTGVLFISVDSLRADHVSAYGYQSPTQPGIPTTPNIDRLLAEEGLRYTRAFSTTSWTLPSHLAMLTGLPDELHGVRDLPDRLHGSHAMLQEIFRAAGWRTFGIWSGPNLHPWFGFERGFEEYVDCSSMVVEDTAVFQGEDPDQVVALHDRSHAGVTGPAILAAFEKWWPTIGPDEPFFAFVHMWDVHYDYTPPEQHDLFYPQYQGTIDGREFRNLVLPAGDYEGLQRLISLYDGEIHYTDENIGRILSLLQGSGRMDETLVVFTADHGEEFMEHGALGHKIGLQDESIHVPLILRYPPLVPVNETSNDMVSLADLAPTLLDLCGLAPRNAMWGTSLRPTFDGSIEPRALPLELTYRPLEIEMRGMRTEDYKVLRFKQGGGGHLIDYATDPHEQHILKSKDLPRGDPRLEAAKEFWRELDQRAARLQRMEQGEMPEGLVEDLTETGYIGDEPAAPREPGNSGDPTEPTEPTEPSELDAENR